MRPSNTEATVLGEQRVEQSPFERLSASLEVSSPRQSRGGTISLLAESYNLASPSLSHFAGAPERKA